MVNIKKLAKVIEAKKKEGSAKNEFLFWLQ